MESRRRDRYKTYAGELTTLGVAEPQPRGIEQPVWPLMWHAWVLHRLVPWRNDMTKTIDALAAEVLQLPTADRTRLLDRVVASLDADAERDAAWDTVAAQRDAEIEDGTEQAVPLDDVLKRLRAELQ